MISAISFCLRAVWKLWNTHSREKLLYTPKYHVYTVRETIGQLWRCRILWTSGFIYTTSYHNKACVETTRDYYTLSTCPSVLLRQRLTSPTLCMRVLQELVLWNIFFIYLLSSSHTALIIRHALYTLNEINSSFSLAVLKSCSVPFVASRGGENVICLLTKISNLAQFLNLLNSNNYH
jgi:hypothetical protein